MTGGGFTAEGRTHSLVKALRGVPSLGPLGERALLGIVGDSANLFWAAGRNVFRQGTPADGLYIIVSGRVRVLADDAVEVTQLGPGDYFGEFSLLLGSDHGHDVEAVEDCELMVVPKERFDALLEGNPELAVRIREKAEERRAANVGATRG
jgi:CRP-like cAMP-binding protein